MSVRLKAGLSWLVIAVAGVYGVYHAIVLRWVCDDAFISFRYAANLINGHGLVFNVGERVEGYTNFLWTILIALGMKLNIDPDVFTHVLSIGSYVFTVSIFIFLSKKIFYPDENEFFIPLAALCLLVQYNYQLYATSGLETASYAMFIAWAYMMLLFAEDNRSCLYAGFAMVFVPLSRPDGLMFCFLGAFYLLVIGKGDLKKLLFYLLPLLLIYLPYWITRFLYYGYPFPNTYYAKSGNLAYYSQGWKYFALYFKTYFVFALLPIFILALLPRIIKEFFKSDFRISLPQRAFVLGILFIIPYVFFVVRVGGDFMFARFFIPVVPLMYFCLELGARQLIHERQVLWLVMFFILIFSVFYWDQYNVNFVVDNVSYEWEAYPAEKIAQEKEKARKIGKYFRAPNIEVLFHGGQAMLVYYADIPVAVEGAGGLTDEYVAHLPVENRGRPGHEKHAPLEYLYARGVNFSILPNDDEISKIKFNGYEAQIGSYENEVMEWLKQFPEVEFTDFPHYLDGYIADISSKSASEIENDYEYFLQYYFRHNDDRKREAYFIERLFNRAYKTTLKQSQL